VIEWGRTRSDDAGPAGPLAEARERCDAGDCEHCDARERCDARDRELRPARRFGRRETCTRRATGPRQRLDGKALPLELVDFARHGDTRRRAMVTGKLLRGLVSTSAGSPAPVPTAVEEVQRVSASPPCPRRRSCGSSTPA
jgi:hypothetical protein